MSHLTIGELAAGAGVTTSTLRFYEDRGLISSQRTSGNQRRYSKAVLRRVPFIRTAQQVGLTLDEVAETLLPSRVNVPRPRLTGSG
jgi:MerR family transcriptional regulator, redox-sensitive transcriptional activator SoxR